MSTENKNNSDRDTFIENTIYDNNFLIKNVFFNLSNKFTIPNKKITLKIINILKKALFNRNLLKTSVIQVFNIENIGDNYNNIVNYIKKINDIYIKKDKNEITEENPYKIIGGGEGGHKGAFIFNEKDGERYKKYKNKPKYILQNKNDISNLDIELFIYLFFLQIYNNNITNNNSNEKNSTNQNTQIPEFSLIVDIVKDILTIDILPDLNDKKNINITQENNNKYYVVGNMKKQDGNIIDYKLGTYTINLSEQNVNTLISSNTYNGNVVDISATTDEESKLDEESKSKPKLKNKFILNLTYLAKLYNDLNSTSNQFGFRCEGTDDMFNKIYKEYFYLNLNTKYNPHFNTLIDPEIYLDNNSLLDSKHLLFFVNDNDNGTTAPTNIKDYTQTIKIKNKTYNFNPDKGIVDEKQPKYKPKILINKLKYFTKFNVIYQEFCEKLYMYYNSPNSLNDNYKIMLKCIIMHYKFVNLFDVENKVLFNITSFNPENFNKFPNYFLHPISLFEVLYKDYTNEDKILLQGNLNNFITKMCINQFNAIINNEKKIIMAFVGSSLLTNLKTKDVRLIDFGHPIFMNASNLTYLLKKDGKFYKPFKSDAENYKYRELFSIFINFMFGALSYYFMLTIFLDINSIKENIDKNNDESNKNHINNTNQILFKIIPLLYFSLYYTQGLNMGFPKIMFEEDNKIKLYSAVNYTEFNIYNNQEYSELIYDYNNNINNINNLKPYLSTFYTIKYNKYRNLRCDIAKNNYQLLFSKEINNTLPSEFEIQDLVFNNIMYKNM